MKRIMALLRKDERVFDTVIRQVIYGYAQEPGDRRCVLCDITGPERPVKQSLRLAGLGVMENAGSKLTLLRRPPVVFFLGEMSVDLADLQWPAADENEGRRVVAYFLQRCCLIRIGHGDLYGDRFCVTSESPSLNAPVSSIGSDGLPQ